MRREVSPGGDRFRTARLWVAIAIAAPLGGLLAAWAGLPAAWLLGPMLATLAVRRRDQERRHLPVALDRGAHAALGISLSAAVEPSALAVVAAHWPLVLICVVAILALGIAAGLALARLSGIPRATAVLGMIPGGASAMVAMSSELQADVRLVAFMQYVRVVLIVVLASLGTRLLQQAIPGAFSAGPAPAAPPVAGPEAAVWLRYLLTGGLALVGTWLGQRLRLPAGALVGPVLVGVATGASGLFQTAWPPGTLPVVYALIGVTVALQFDAAALGQIRRLLAALLGTVLSLLLCCALLGLALAAASELDLVSSMLATFPGGLDAVAVAALETRGNIPLILGVQITRLLAMVLFAPFVVRWLSRGEHARSGA